MSAILENKFRFAYRIRVENVSDQNVQLLGRYWRIRELTADGEEDDSKEDVVVNSPATGAGESKVDPRRVITFISLCTEKINFPLLLPFSVGNLPVLRPGQVFEYMSGTDLASTKGNMLGHFYMARVPQDTNSAKAGDHVEALNAGDKFEVEVAPFPLDATSTRAP